MSEPPATRLIASVPPKFARCTWPAISAAADGAPPSMSTRSTSSPRFAKRPSSFAMNGARFAGVTFPYEALILIGSGAGAAVAAPGAADGSGREVGPAPQAASTRVSTVIGTSARDSDRISRLPPPTLPPAANCYTIRSPPQITRVDGGFSVPDEEGRVFLRGISSEQYGLSEFRRRQRAAPRVRRAGTVTDDASVGHSGDSDQGLSRTWRI